MFRKPVDTGEEVSGQARMFASAVKMIGLDPQVIEGISKGLLHDLKMVVGQQAELLARQEHMLRCTEALDSKYPSAWEEYLERRRAEWQAAQLGGGHPNGTGGTDGGRSGDADAGPRTGG